MPAINAFEDRANFLRACHLTDTLDACGADSATLESLKHHDDYWTNAATAAGVMTPNTETREIVIRMMQSRECAKFLKASA